MTKKTKIKNFEVFFEFFFQNFFFFVFNFYIKNIFFFLMNKKGNFLILIFIIVINFLIQMKLFVFVLK